MAEELMITVKISDSNEMVEYQEVGSIFRFFAGLRFSFLVSFSTFFGILIGAYNYVWAAEDRFLDVWKSLLVGIPVFGLFVTLAGWLIERRTVVLYQTCLRRGEILEQERGVQKEFIIY